MHVLALAEAADMVPDGASVALGRPPALALVGALVARGAQGLHLLGVPTGDIAIELMVNAGCARIVESSGVDLGELGGAPAFARAVEEGRLQVVDSSCPAMLMALQAGASGISWTPVRGLSGSDLLARRPDYRVVPDPYAGEGNVVLVPAIRPDVALLRGRRADEHGNVVIATTYDDRLIAQAARTVIVEVAEQRPGATDRLARDEQVVPASFIDALVIAEPQSPAGAAADYLEARAAPAHS